MKKPTWMKEMAKELRKKGVQFPYCWIAAQGIKPKRKQRPSKLKGCRTGKK